MGIAGNNLIELVFSNNPNNSYNKIQLAAVNSVSGEMEEMNEIILA